MLNFPLGPVDLEQPYTQLIVAKQPCDLPWVRRVTLRIGEHAIQGDIRGYLADPYVRRLQAAGVLTATYIDHAPAAEPVVAPTLVFDPQTGSGQILVDNKVVTLIEGRVQVPGELADDQAPVFSHKAPHDAPPAPVVDPQVQPVYQVAADPLAGEPVPATMEEFMSQAPATMDIPLATVPDALADTPEPLVSTPEPMPTDSPVLATVAVQSATVDERPSIEPQVPSPVAAPVRRRQVPTQS